MAELTTFFTAPDKRALVLPGVPADHSYTFKVRAYRRVDNDISPTGFILSPEVMAAVYKPTDVPAFDGDITGTIQGRPSLDVVLNLESIASDGVLSTTEKPGLILQWNQVSYNWASLDAKATDIGGFQTEQDAASAAMSALETYLMSLVPSWSDTTQHTPIDKVIFQNRWASAYSALADLQAVITGRKGADAKSLIVISDRQTIAYDSAGAPSPATQTTKFTAQKQNTTATVTWSIKDANGVAQVASSFLSSTTGDIVTMTEAQFDAARNGTSGVIVTGSLNDGSVISDTISVSRVQNGEPGEDGDPGSPGAPGEPGLSVREVTVYKRGPSATTPAGGSYNFGTGVLTPPTGWSTTVPAGAGALWAASGHVSIVGQTGTATPTWLGVGRMAADGSAVNVVFRRSATQPSTPAASAGTPTGWYDSVGDVPAGADPMWASFGTKPDAASNFTWQWAVRQEGLDGAPGPAGPTVSLVADDLSFDFIDGLPVDSAQVITLTATRQNTSEAINWTVAPAVTLGAPNALKRTLSLADLGTHTSVTITATGATSGAKASVTLIRSNQTTPDDSIIPDGGWRAGVTRVTAPWGRARRGLIRTYIQ